jgi:pilus assembly protein Flp/PilA
MMTSFKALIRSRDGANAIEYALIATLISLAGIAAYQLLGTNLTAIYNTVASQI